MKKRQEYWEARKIAKIEVAKEKAYSKLHVKLDTKGGGMDYQLPGQRD